MLFPQSASSGHPLISQYTELTHKDAQCNRGDFVRRRAARGGEHGLFRKPVREGAAILEFAIVAPVVLLFVLGLIELGRGLMVSHLLTNAARQGCRVGVVEGRTNSDITAAVNSVLSPLGISGDTITVDINDGVANASSAQAGDEITVLVSVPVSAVTWVPLTKYLSGSLIGKYTLRRE